MALGLLKKIGKGVALGGLGMFKGAGKVAQAAAPIAGMIPGVGTLGGAALGAWGGLASGRGLRGAALGAASGAAGGLAGKLLGGVGGVGGLGAVLGKLGISPGQAAQLGLAGLTAVQGAKQAAKANQINQGVLAQLQAQEAAKGRVRQQVLGRLMGPQAGREDLGSLFASENPFARSIRPTPAPATGQTASLSGPPDVPTAPLDPIPLSFRRRTFAMPNRGQAQNRVRALLQ